MVVLPANIEEMTEQQLRELTESTFPKLLKALTEQ